MSDGVRRPTSCIGVAGNRRSRAMKWITREHPRVDRVACPWLIEKFVDQNAECSYDAFVHKYKLDADPAMAYMAKVIRGADTADKTITPESVGVEAILDGLRHQHYPDDQKQREASRPVLDALYAYCQKKAEAKP